MKKSKKIIFFGIFSVLLVSFQTFALSEIMYLTGCKNLKDGFIKNEYILDLEKSLMTRNYVYNDKTFKKYRVTDLSVKKENSLTKFIYRQDNNILTDKVGYPQFYTQLLFEIDNPIIKIKTVINNEEAVSSMSKCKKIERFEKES